MREEYDGLPHAAIEGEGTFKLHHLGMHTGSLVDVETGKQEYSILLECTLQDTNDNESKLSRLEIIVMEDDIPPIIRMLINALAVIVEMKGPNTPTRLPRGEG